MDVNYTDEQQQWRSVQDADDRQTKEFYNTINEFPNLFTLQPQFQNIRRIEQMLKKQETKRDSGTHQYELEAMRCCNLIVFLLFLLHNVNVALEYCQTLLPKYEKSIITLSSLAILQWKLGFKTESKGTLSKLQDFYKYHDLEYLQNVAKSEKGYAFLCFGPKYFYQAMDIFQEVISACDRAEVYLWKYDLALAIRRNFNIFVYLEHPNLSASVLAEKAEGLLMDLIKRCPNIVYKARSLAELASLISHLKSFVTCCKDEDKGKIQEICKQDHMILIDQALQILQDGDDSYVFCICGRLFKYDGSEEKAIEYLEKAHAVKEDDAIVNQLLAKTHFSLYLKNKKSGMKHDEDHNNVESMEERHPAERLWSWPPDSVDLKPGPPVHSQSLDFSSGPPADSAMKSASSQYMRDKLSSPEGLRLKAEFDKSASQFLYEDGSLKSVNTGNVGSICTTPGQNTRSGAYDVLAAEFDESVLLKNDGTFKSQETECVGNIRKHHYVDRPPSKAPLKTSHSFPPPASASSRRHCAVPGLPTTSKESVLKCLLKTSFHYHKHDESDPRVHKVEGFFVRAFEIDPTNKALLYDMGRFYQGLNKLHKSVKYFQMILSGIDPTPLELVNAYEQLGLCLLKLSQKEETGSVEQESLVTRAEDMLMRSLTEGSRAVGHLPRVSSRRATLWRSYPEMLKLLEESSSPVDGHHRQMRKAEVHVLVGRYLEAIKVYQDVLALANASGDRKKAILGLVSANVGMDKTNDARFILDLFLVSDEREVILHDKDDVTCKLRSLAVSVYSEAATDAVKSELLRDAQLSFKSALVVSGVMSNRADDDVGQIGESHTDGTYDVCVFTDEGKSAVSVWVDGMSSSLVKVMQNIFGMRVNLNDAGAALGHLSFIAELELARAVGIVIFVLEPGADQLTPRMTYLANSALQSGRTVIPVVRKNSVVPPPLHLRQPFCGDPELINIDERNPQTFKQNCDGIKRLFNFIIDTHQHTPLHDL